MIDKLQIIMTNRRACGINLILFYIYVVHTKGKKHRNIGKQNE